MSLITTSPKASMAMRITTFSRTYIFKWCVFHCHSFVFRMVFVNICRGKWWPIWFNLVLMWMWQILMGRLPCTWLASYPAVWTSLVFHHQICHSFRFLWSGMYVFFSCDIVDVFVNQPVDSESDIPNILNGPVDVFHWHYRSKFCVFLQTLTLWITFQLKKLASLCYCQPCLFLWLSQTSILFGPPPPPLKHGDLGLQIVQLSESAMLVA